MMNTMNSFSADHLMSLVQRGLVSKQDLLEMCLNWMTDEDLCDMMETNDLPLPEEDADAAEDAEDAEEEEDVDWTEDDVDYNKMATMNDWTL